MKRKVWALFLLALAGIVYAQPPTTTTYVGTVKDLTGATVTSGRITWKLNAPQGGVIPGTGSFVSTTVSCGIDANGHPVSTTDATSPCVITNNTALTPTGTSYTMCTQPQFVSPGSCIVTYAPGGTIDISTVVPVPTTGPFNYAGTPGPPGPPGPTGPPGGSTSYPGVSSDGSNGLNVAGKVGAGTVSAPLINSTTYLAPSGDTTGATDQAAMVAAIATGNSIHAAKGQYYFTGNISITAPTTITGDGASNTFFNLTSAGNKLFVLRYGGGQLNNESAGAVISGFAVQPKAGVTPTSGAYAFDLAGLDATHYMSGLRIQDVDFWGVCGAITTGSFMVSNWFKNLHITIMTAVSGCHGIYYNTPPPGGDGYFIDVNLSNAGGDVLIHQSDVSTWVNLKTNWAGVVFDNQGGGVRFINPSLEGAGAAGTQPTCGINFTGTAANIVDISINGGQIDLMPHAFCSNGVGTLNPNATGNVTRFSADTIIKLTQDSFTGRIDVGALIENINGLQVNGAAPLNHCLVGNGTYYVDSTTCGGAPANTWPVAAPTPTFSPVAGVITPGTVATTSCASGTAYTSCNGSTLAAGNTCTWLSTGTQFGRCELAGTNPTVATALYTSPAGAFDWEVAWPGTSLTTSLSAQSITPGHSPTVGQMAVLHVIGEKGGNFITADETASITSAGVSGGMTKAGCTSLATGITGGGWSDCIFYGIVTSGSAITFTLTRNGTTNVMYAISSFYNNISTFRAFANNFSATTTTTFLAGALTGSVASDTIVTFCSAVNTSETLTAGAGMTLIYSDVSSITEWGVATGSNTNPTATATIAAKYACATAAFY